MMFSKITAYRKHFDKTKYMFSLIKNKEFLEKYNEIWDKFSNIAINRT